MEKPKQKAVRQEHEGRQKPFQATAAGFVTLKMALRDALESTRIAMEERGTTPAEAEVVQLPRAVADRDRGEDAPLRAATRVKK